MLNIVLLCTLWLCIWVLGSKERELKAVAKELFNANDKIDELDDSIIDLEAKIDELDDTIIDLEERIKDLEDEVFDLREQGGLFNE